MSLQVPERILIPAQGTARVVNATGRRGCVDPRLVVPYDTADRVIAFHHETDYGETRSAGADLGDVAVVMAANPRLSPQDAVRMVALAARLRGSGFAMHNDTLHADQSDRLGGCGHFGLLAGGKYEDRYGVSGEKVQAAGEYAVRLATAGELRVESAMLDGPHEHEVGVLVVTGYDHSVETQLDDGSRFFRHDVTRHDAILNTVAAYAGEAPQELQEIAAAHRDESLVHLAPGLPIYLIDLASASSRAELQGFVPA